MTTNVENGKEEANIGETIPDLNNKSFWIQNILASLVPRNLYSFRIKKLPMVSFNLTKIFIQF